MHEIAGVDAVIDGKAKSISGVHVLAPYRLRIQLTRPVSDFIARLTIPFFCPVRRARRSPSIDNPAGSGPYYVASDPQPTARAQAKPLLPGTTAART